jgi:hypothetical protein
MSIHLLFLENMNLRINLAQQLAQFILTMSNESSEFFYALGILGCLLNLDIDKKDLDFIKLDLRGQTSETHVLSGSDFPVAAFPYEIALNIVLLIQSKLDEQQFILDAPSNPNPTGTGNGLDFTFLGQSDVNEFVSACIEFICLKILHKPIIAVNCLRQLLGYLDQFLITRLHVDYLKVIFLSVYSLALHHI